MERIISTIVEDVPEGVFLVAPYYDMERTDDKGKRIACADIIIPHKKVILFDEDGNMEVKYYTESEWNGTECSEGSREPNLHYTPMHLSHYAFLRYLNRLLADDTLLGIATDIKDGHYDITLDNLTPYSQQLIEYVLNWDGKTPFAFCERVYQTPQEEDDGTHYYVECFKFA